MPNLMQNQIDKYFSNESKEIFVGSKHINIRNELTKNKNIEQNLVDLINLISDSIDLVLRNESDEVNYNEIVNEVSKKIIEHAKILKVINAREDFNSVKKILQIKNKILKYENLIENEGIELPLKERTKKLINKLLVQYDNLKDKKETNDVVKKLYKDKKVIIIKLKKLLNDSDFIETYNLIHIKPTESKKNNIITNQEEYFLALLNNLSSAPKAKDDNKSFSLLNETEGKLNLGAPQLKYVAIMIEKSIANKNLNKRLSILIKEKNNEFKEKYLENIEKLIHFSYKTQFFSDYKRLIEKLNKLIKSPNEKNSDKLSFFEFGRLNDLLKIRKFLNELNNLNVLNKSNKLTNLYHQALKVEQLFKLIEEKIFDDVHYQEGDLIMTNSKKTNILKNRKTTKEQFLMEKFVSSYGHAMQVYIDPIIHQKRISHIVNGYRSDVVEFLDVLDADCFRINVAKLIAKPMLDRLSLAYEDNEVEKIINNLYKKNIQKLHAESQKKFKSIENDEGLRYQAGYADFRLYGHSKSKSSDKEVRDYMFGYGKYPIKNKMICSEFVARSITAALFETNENLTNHLEYYENKHLKAQIIQMPFVGEKLKYIHPERLVKLLNQKKCLEKLPHPSILSALVNQEDLTKTIKSTSSKIAAGEVLYREIADLSKQHKNKEQFIFKAKKYFKKYAKNESLDINYKNLAVNTFLKKSLDKLYNELNKNPSGLFDKFISWLSNIAIWLGISNDKNKIIVKTTISSLEKIQYQNIKDYYLKSPLNFKNKLNDNFFTPKNNSKFPNSLIKKHSRSIFNK